MKLLIIDEEFPFPLNTGKRIRSFYLTRVLARRHDVFYLAYGDEPSPGTQFMRANNIKPYAVEPPDRRKSGAGFYIKLLKSLNKPYPYIVTSHYTERFKIRLSQLLNREKFDCLICEWTPYAVYLSDITCVKKIVVAHNIEASIWRGYKANERNLLKKLYISNQVEKVEAFENQCFEWADGATAVSEEDAAQISSNMLPYQVEIIENGVDTEYFWPRADTIDRDTVVFTGSMDWRPNQDAALYFAREIFPRVKFARPNLKVFLVGRDPSAQVRRLGDIDGITVTGTVEDVRPYMARAALYIVPLRIGGGSRLKILEAMAMQKAVISTTLGAQGLRVENGKNIILRDHPILFAFEIIRLLDDDDYREQIALNARRTVEEHYRWEKLGQKLDNYICRIVQN